jgi:Asp-tRNA(Asn)/Glu-tRNA(Gln) amidotransferase A subunit family amidase
MKITLGIAALADAISENDALAVKSLGKAGAIVYCKTTMPQTGMVRCQNVKSSK